MATNKYYTHITAKHNWYDLKLKEVWQYRDLILLFTKRSFVVRYKQTILGPAWIFLNPLISSIIYAFIFGTVAGIGTDGVPELLQTLQARGVKLCVFSNKPHADTCRVVQHYFPLPSLRPLSVYM